METVKGSISKAIYGDSANTDTGDNLGRNNEGTTQRSQTGTGLGRDMTSDTGNGPEAKYKPYEPTMPMRHDASDTKLGGREQIGTHEETASGFGKPAPSSNISAIGGRSENVGTGTKNTYTPGMQSLIHEESSKTELPNAYNTEDNTSSSAYNTSAPITTEYVDPNANKTHHRDDYQNTSTLGGSTLGGSTLGGPTSSSDRKHHDTGFSSAHDSGLSSGAYGTDRSGLTSTHRDATSGSSPGYDTGNTGLSGTHSTHDTTSHHGKSAAGAGVAGAGLGYALASEKPSTSDHSRTSAFTEDTSSSGVGHKYTPTTRDTTTSEHLHTAKPSSSAFAGTEFSNKGGESTLRSTGRDLDARDTTSSSHTYDNHSPISGLGTHDNKHSSGLPSSQTDNSGISGIGRSQPDAATSHLGSTSTRHTDVHPGDRRSNVSPTHSLPLDDSAPVGPTFVSKDVQGNPSKTAGALGEPPEPSVLAGAVHGGPSTTATGSRTAGAAQAANIPSLSDQGANRPTESPQSRAAQANRGTGDAYEKSTGLAAEGGDFDASRPGAGREADRLLDEHGVARETGDKKHGLLGGHSKDTTSGTHTGKTGTTGTDTGTKASHTGVGHGATGQHTSDPAVRSAHDDPTTGHGQGAVGDNTTSSGTHTGAHGEEKVKLTDKIKDKLHLGPKH